MGEIVLVEDDDDIRAITAQMLRRAGHTVVEAPDGAAGLQAVLTRVPHLVVSDIDMPVMSGLDLCRVLRSDPRTASLPVLLVSGSLLPGDRRPFDAQASAILVKPFRRGELIDRVEELLRDRPSTS
ncbi:response regulator [Actinoplanes sp. NPDC049802]|uniref:response regulator n=1 Tax=Actinoplanes sp. NPDC049802 TaxID=3154742 RepID=UPI0033FB3FC6